MPADIFADLDRVPDLLTIDREIRKGLPADKARMESARLNEDYYKGDNAKHVKRRPGEDDLHYQNRTKCASLITRKAIRTLAGPLYKPGPTRRIESSPRANEWYEKLCAKCHVNAKMQSANRAAMMHGVAVLQIEPTGLPNRPVKLWLWKGFEVAVFCLDGDPESPWAVVTRDTVPAGDDLIRARYRAWSAREYRSYQSEPFKATESPIGKPASLVSKESGESPFPGVLPFVFVRNEPAECDFWDGAIGPLLRECNAELDAKLSNLDEHVDAFLNPKGYLLNVSVASTQGQLNQVGELYHLRVPAGTEEGDNRITPDVFYRQVSLGVDPAWAHIKNRMDSRLEESDIPLTAVRSDASTDLSGVAIVAKTLPLIEYTRERQVAFTEIEDELCGKCLAVVGGYHVNAASKADEAAPAAELSAVAADPQFVAIWPEPQIPMPTVERDNADQWELDSHMSDPIEVLAKRRGLTLEQAEELAAESAERWKTWNEIHAETMPEPGSGAPGAPPEIPDPDAPPDPGAKSDGEEDPPED